ncbi:MAG: DeoR/GlpR transcriptional regulator [Ruminococcaceae bacterium]|nr:DeoR/GlpR transcriptional regulator [Oscillospiraceae bacterium]
MFNLERQNEILRIMLKSGSVSTKELAKVLYASEPTVRRDLTELEKQGKILRTHGGAVLRMAADSEIPLRFREDQNSDAKRILTQKAAEFISDGNIIFMDASSTVSHLVDYLEKFNDLVVITNSPKASMRLGEKGIKNYCTGGLLLMHSVAYAGSEAERFIANINADICFFSSRGYMENGMISDSSVEEASVRKAMLKNSAKSYYLCDNSKKNTKYIYNICSTQDVTDIITD